MRWVKMECGAPAGHRGQRAYTLIEVMAGVFVVGAVAISLCGAFSSGLNIVQATRENLRATQILTQKAEAMRLLNWNQNTNQAIASPNFVDWFDPKGTNTGSAGTRYRGVVSVQPAPASIPGHYRSSMRLVTVTVYWTNYFRGTTNVIVRSRQLQTLVARLGMQNYVY